jgi:hypothetical protein
VKPFDEYPVGERLLCAFRSGDAPFEVCILERTGLGYTKVCINNGPEAWYRPDNFPTVLDELPEEWRRSEYD